MILGLTVFFVIALGACMQRISGMGLGLVGGPVLMVYLGPVEGIMVVNVLAVLNAAATTLTVRSDIDWKKFAQISSVMVVGSVPAAYLISQIDSAPLMVIAGGALLVALAVVTWGKNFIPPLNGLGPTLSAGVIGGFTNTLAGIAGPVITVYAQAARWPQNIYAATLQPIFMVGGLISVLTKLAFGAGGFEHVSWLIWPAGIAGMLVGLFIGVKASSRVSREAARTLSLSIAVAGAAFATARGLLLM